MSVFGWQLNLHSVFDLIVCQVSYWRSVAIEYHYTLYIIHVFKKVTLKHISIALTQHVQVTLPRVEGHRTPGKILQLLEEAG